jgi:uncharacterized protein (DUF488 family)
MSNILLSKPQYILTFGYGNRKNYEELIAYIQEYAVNYIIDVRQKPSAWSRQWYGNQIEKLCQSKGIKYLSKTALGNISGNQNWIPSDKDEANKSLEEVAEIAQTNTVLLICAEKDWRRCHRVDVAKKLEELVNFSAYPETEDSLHQRCIVKNLS